MNLPTTNDFEGMVLGSVPLMDVRAPVEFADGAFPTAVNLPLMNDEERRLVGICYKQKGNAEAVKLGHELVSGEVKAARVAAWVAFLECHPDALLYCFRGGMRSQIAQQWIFEATGKKVQRLEGGYKAFRRYLMDHLEPATLQSTPLILGGRTGVGKTILLQRLENAVDLEAIANHRGSSFGRFTSPQPTPINFENRLAWAFIKHNAAGFSHMVLEDEGRNVGDRYLPPPLVEHFKQADVVVLERSLEERVQITFEEYVVAAQADYQVLYGEEEGLVQWLEQMDNNLFRIRKRLGGLRYQQIKQLLHEGRHREWIEQLLRDYYDPMYDYQLEGKRSNIVFRGGESEVMDYLTGLCRGTISGT